MLYLLGELDAEQSRHVEAQLEAFPELGEDLLRQADVIAGLSQPACRPTLPRVAESNHQLTRWPLVASMVALAACLAIAIIGFKPGASDQDTVISPFGSSARLSESGNAEELLIARAWANHHRTLVDEVSFVESDIDEAPAIAAEDDSLANDSTLSWMFIAVSAGSDSHAAGVTNDG